MKAYRGSGGIAPRNIDLGTRWKTVVSCTPRPLYPKEIASGTHWIRGWVGSGGEKNSQPPGSEPPIIQPVAQRYTNELSRLQINGGNCLKGPSVYIPYTIYYIYIYSKEGSLIFIGKDAACTQNRPGCGDTT
jgi:hypothetical protein